MITTNKGKQVTIVQRINVTDKRNKRVIGRGGNAAGTESSCGPMCHIMGTEVCTSINFPD
jgi:hypothetical protein